MLNEKTAQLKNFFEVFSPKHLECARCLFPARLDRLTYGPLAWSCTFFLQADHLGNRYLGLASMFIFVSAKTLVGNACFPWDWSWILWRHWWFIVCWGFAEYGWVALLWINGLKEFVGRFCWYISSWPRNVNVGFVPSKKVLNGTLAIIITWCLHMSKHRSHHTDNGMQVKLPKTPWMRRLLWDNDLGWVGVRLSGCYVTPHLQWNGWKETVGLGKTELKCIYCLFVYIYSFTYIDTHTHMCTSKLAATCWLRVFQRTLWQSRNPSAAQCRLLPLVIKCFQDKQVSLSS